MRSFQILLLFSFLCPCFLALGPSAAAVNAGIALATTGAKIHKTLTENDLKFLNYQLFAPHFENCRLTSSYTASHTRIVEADAFASQAFSGVLQSASTGLGTSDPARKTSVRYTCYYGDTIEIGFYYDWSMVAPLLGAWVMETKVFVNGVATMSLEVKDLGDVEDDPHTGNGSPYLSHARLSCDTSSSDPDYCDFVGNVYANQYAVISRPLFPLVFHSFEDEPVLTEGDDQFMRNGRFTFTSKHGLDGTYKVTHDALSEEGYVNNPQYQICQRSLFNTWNCNTERHDEIFSSNSPTSSTTFCYGQLCLVPQKTVLGYNFRVFARVDRNEPLSESNLLW